MVLVDLLPHLRREAQKIGTRCHFTLANIDICETSQEGFDGFLLEFFLDLVAL